MNNILKWVGLTIIALLIIRFILNTIFSISTWAFQTVLTIFTSSAMGVILFLILLAIIGYIFYVKHKANQSYEQVIRQPVQQIKLEGKRISLPAPATDVIDFMQQFSTNELSALIHQYYKNDEIGFGEAGATEFIGSVLLAEYKPKLQGAIQTGHLRVFEQQWGPLQFSDFMDNIVQQSGVPYAKWSEMCRLLYTVHPTLKNHPCAKPAAVVLVREKLK